MSNIDKLCEATKEFSQMFENSDYNYQTDYLFKSSAQLKKDVSNNHFDKTRDDLTAINANAECSVNPDDDIIFSFWNKDQIQQGAKVAKLIKQVNKEVRNPKFQYQNRQFNQQSRAKQAQKVAFDMMNVAYYAHYACRRSENDFLADTHDLEQESNDIGSYEAKLNRLNHIFSNYEPTLAKKISQIAYGIGFSELDDPDDSESRFHTILSMLDDYFIDKNPEFRETRQYKWIAGSIENDKLMQEFGDY